MPTRDGRGEPHAGPRPLLAAIHAGLLIAVIDKVRGGASVLPVLTFMAAVSTTAFADPAPGTHHVAFISSGPAAANVENFAAFKQGLAENGYIEGNSILYALIKLAVFGRWLPGDGVDVQLHPMANAA